MFIFSAADLDTTASLDRLVRLMVNIERGAKVYEWRPGSTADPLPVPGPNPLTLTVEPCTAGAPPIEVDYRPTVGLIYYIATEGMDPGAFANKLKAKLAQTDDSHLAGHLTVETAPHTSLSHRGRTYSATELVGSHRTPSKHEWRAESLYPTRYVQFAKSGELPGHISLCGAFSWYILPASAFATVERIVTMTEFNAMVAAIYLDPALAPEDETSDPVFDDGAKKALRVRDAPAAVREYFTHAYTRSHAPPPVLIFDRDHFDVAGSGLCQELLDSWAQPPEVPRAGPEELESLRKFGTDTCSHCNTPLWGQYYAIRDPMFSPHVVPLCRWCLGCFPPETAAMGASTVVHPRSLQEALEASDDPVYSELARLLGASVSRGGGAAVCAAAFIVTNAQGGAEWVAVPRKYMASAEDRYLCLSRPELPRVQVVALDRVAEVVYPPEAD